MSVAGLRKKIDGIDKKIVELLAERQNIVKELSIEKEKKGLPVLDVKREKEVVDNWLSNGKRFGLGNDSVLSFVEVVLRLSKKEQEKEK